MTILPSIRGTVLRALLLAPAGLLALSPAPAPAQMRCGQRAEVIRHLETRFGETQRSIGLQEGRGIVEIFANPDSGSWTILLTTPEGVSCLMAAGDSFRDRAPRRPDAPA